MSSAESIILDADTARALAAARRCLNALISCLPPPDNILLFNIKI
jgi:hypothetical protein